MTHAGRMERFENSDLYVVITEAFCAGRSSLEVLGAVLEAGVTLIQFREKDLDDEHMYDRALAFRRLTNEAGALLIIDDRIDIALAVDADGVHLGRHDLPISIARKLAPEMIIGASTHNVEQAREAERAEASCVNIGPIFPTQTKLKTASPLGPEIIEEVSREVSIPITCMGGIKLENISEVLAHGARHPALVTAVTAHPDPKAAAAELRAKIVGCATKA